MTETELLYRPSIESLYSTIEFTDEDEYQPIPKRYASNSTLRTELSIQTNTTITISCCEPFEFEQVYEPMSPTYSGSTFRDSKVFSREYDDLTLELLTPSTPTQLDYVDPAELPESDSTQIIPLSPPRHVSVNPFPASFMLNRHHSGSMSPPNGFQEHFDALTLSLRPTSSPAVMESALKPVKSKKKANFFRNLF
jgi:hypothetical protein